jgi:opacity protein-like surface antigen
MRRLLVVLATGLLIAQAGAAYAQYDGKGVEIAPFAAFRWGGGLSTISGVRNFDTQDNIAYGIGIGKRLPQNSSVELQWTHFSGDVDVTFNGGLETTAGPLRRDDIFLNGYWYSARPGSSVMPFLTAGAGASIFDTDELSSYGRFGWQIGAGIRTDPSEKVGVRFGFRWIPVWITTGSGVWCDPFYCYSVGTGESYDQFDASATLIFKL